MKRCLITGASGFVGSHLTEYLHEKGYEVFGTIRWRSRLEFIDTMQDKIKLVEADLMDSHSLFSINERSTTRLCLSFGSTELCAYLLDCASKDNVCKYCWTD